MGGEKGKLIDKGTSPPRIHFASAHRSLIYGFGRCFGNFYAFALFLYLWLISCKCHTNQLPALRIYRLTYLSDVSMAHLGSEQCYGKN